MRARLLNPVTVGLCVAGAVIAFRGCGTSNQTNQPMMAPQLIADAVPTMATSLELLYISGEPSSTGPVNQIKMAAQQPRVTFDMPATATGEQRIGLVAFDTNRCLLATEDFILYVQREKSLERRLLDESLALFAPRSARADVFPGCGGTPPPGPRSYTVQLVPLATPDCRDKPVRMSSVDKASVQSGTAIRIRGYGFHPQATVTLNGMAPLGKADISPTLILVTVPTLTVGKVTLKIQNPDSNTDQRDDLLTFN